MAPSRLPTVRTVATLAAAVVAAGCLMPGAAAAASELTSAARVSGTRGTSILPPGGVSEQGLSRSAATSEAQVRMGLRAAPRPTPAATPTPTPKPTPTPTPTPSAGTKFGTTVWTGDGSSFAQALSRQRTKLGALEVVRVFYTGLPEAWPGKAGLSAGPVSVSFKGSAAEIVAGRYDAFFTTWFANAPRNRTVWWTYFHEPEDNIADGAMTSAQYKAAYRRLDALADKAGNPDLKTTTMWMCYTLRPGSGRDWRNYYPGSDVVDVMGWDCYNGKATSGVYQDPATLLGPLVAVSKSMGKPFGMGDFGSAKASTDAAGAKRAVWLSATATYLKNNGAQFVNYYDAVHAHSGVPTDFRLLDTASITVWKKFIAS